MTLAEAAPIDALVRLLDLEAESDGHFTGHTPDGSRRLFGGLVAAQAVIAAGRTVSGAGLHSLHAYFLRPGRAGVPIRYAVHPLKDGRVFHARSVVASQGEEVIFALNASFARPEEGISHQGPMPEAPSPETVPDEEGRREQRGWFHLPVEVRNCDPDVPTEAQTPGRRLWLRPRGALPEDPLLHTAVLVYASDRRLVSTAARPHRIAPGHRRGASLDHSFWLHRSFRFDDWVLHAAESPVSHSARALVLGALYRRDGVRVASVAQEGLVRIRP